MVQMKGGKPVVPSLNDPANRDIKAQKMNMNIKSEKEMKVPTRKINNDADVQAMIANNGDMNGASMDGGNVGSKKKNKDSY